MRLVTFQTKTGSIHIGALRADDHEIVALDSVAPSMLALIDGGASALAQAKSALAAAAKVVARADVRLLAPIPRPKQNVMCLGMNYVAHAIESLRARGSEIKLPEYPVFFTKALNTVCGDGDSVPLDPNVTAQLDYEVELAYVFGRTAKNVKKADALDYVFGYTILNDISARDLQNRHQQFFKGKSLDNSGPIGPCIVTADEIPDPATLAIKLRLNGELRQSSHTGDLIFDIPSGIEYLTLGTTIEAGQIVCTGTPAGVGMGLTPPAYMKAGDVLEAEIEKIGVLTNYIVAA
ncbi:MAG: fumarylacetoacetate hydrolase family protein [Chloroflexales bacterium]|jgi:2-keto-4-pentenoate hydratase/2-oxohepta-3-ene-1,7-dioic acid hydratase in catechol pathway|nr:fumarylacetoacetate hydrolase family protein [Chloroflexales bacterium]